MRMLMKEQAALLRILATAQVAVLDWGEEDLSVQTSPAIELLERCAKELPRAVKALKRLDGV